MSFGTRYLLSHTGTCPIPNSNLLQVVSLRLAHGHEISIAHEAQFRELESLQRFHASEIACIARSSSLSTQVSDLAEKVAGAVGSIDRLQKDMVADRLLSSGKLSYRESYSSALTQQEQRVIESHRLAGKERAELMRLAEHLEVNLAISVLRRLPQHHIISPLE